MAGVMARDFSGINADRRIPYVHLSRSYGNHSTVRISKLMASNMRIHGFVSVRELAAQCVVAPAFEALEIFSGFNKLIVKRDPEQQLGPMYSKFQKTLPSLTLDELKGQLAAHKEDPCNYFYKAADILRANLAKLEGEPWIKRTAGAEPLEIVKEEEVINFLRSKRKPNLIFSILTASTALTSLTSFAVLPSVPLLWKVACPFVTVISFGLWLFTSGGFGIHLKAFKEQVAHKPIT